jgi:copper(I)-binding protein
MPGTNMGVGYLKMTNNSDSAITVRSASSPDFGRVEIHQTTIADGVSRMRPLNEVQIDAGATVTFEPGGRHLMLFDPKPGIAPGSPVSLEVTHNKGLLIVSATMQTRLPAE